MRLTAAIATPPVSLAAFKAHAKIEHEHEDTVLQALLDAAATHVETGARRALTARSAVFHAAGLFLTWWFPVAPVRSLTSLKVLRADGGEVAVTGALVSGDQEPRLSVEADAWPEAIAGDVVEVAAEIGYDGVVAQPEVAGLKNAIIMIAADKARQRGATAPVDLRSVPFGANALIRQNRYVRPSVAVDLCGRVQA